MMRPKKCRWEILIVLISIVLLACGNSKAESESPEPWPTSGETCVGNSVRNVEELQAAVEASNIGQTISLAQGVFELPQTLFLKSGTTLCGQGAGKTIVRGTSSWQPSTELLPKTEQPNAYLFAIEKQNDITIRDMSLHGPYLHGAVYGKQSKRLTLAGLEVKDFLWSSIRTFGMSHMNVHNNDFIDAGGKFKNTTGGALYDHYPKDCEVWNNRVRKSTQNKRPFFGFKGRGGRDCRFHHNDIRAGFAIEYPFDNNVGFEIDHNYIQGTISIPKFGGGNVLEGDVLSFHIHHNVIRKSYGIEFARNNVRVNHNLFDLDPKNDSGNLISDHGRKLSPGPLWMHDNLINNVGRGIFWSKGGYNRIYFFNNHVRALKSSRKSAFFQFERNTDFNSIQIENNIFEAASDNPRPLLSGGMPTNKFLQNNVFKNIPDMPAQTKLSPDKTVGPSEPLRFNVGVRGEIQVNQWSVSGVKP